MTNARRLKAAAAAGLLAAVGILIGASPASAAGAGVSRGESSISEEGEGLPICLAASSGMSVTLHNTGTFTAGTEVFAGETTTVFQADENTEFFFNPAGIFQDAACTQLYLIPGTIDVTTDSATVGTSVTCSSAANYTRVGNEYELTTVLGSNSCDVNGVSADSVLSFTGNQNPCFPGAPFDPCQVPDTEMVGVYVQIP